MPLLDQMIEKMRERWHAYKSEAVTELPPPATLRPREWIISGTYAQIGMSSRRRWVLDHGTIPLDNRTIFESPSGAARVYLGLRYRDAKQRRIYHDQARQLGRCRQPMPLLADPCELRDAVYLDIRRAYWQIMLIAGWDVDYWPGRWLMGGSAPADFPYYENPIARNSLVSCAASSTIVQVAPDGEVIERAGWNSCLNMPLVTLVSNVLNGVAWDLARAGVGLSYANTDGFIVDQKHEGRALAVIAGWGLAAKAKARGNGWVAGVGVYRVGAAESRRPRVRNPYSNLAAPEDIDRLRARFCGLAVAYPVPGHLLGIK